MRRFDILPGIVNDAEHADAIPSHRDLRGESQFYTLLERVRSTKILAHWFGNNETVVECPGGDPSHFEYDIESGIFVCDCPGCHRRAEWTAGNWDVFDWDFFVRKAATPEST